MAHKLSKLPKTADSSLRCLHCVRELKERPSSCIGICWVDRGHQIAESGWEPGWVSDDRLVSIECVQNSGLGYGGDGLAQSGENLLVVGLRAGLSSAASNRFVVCHHGILKQLSIHGFTHQQRFVNSLQHDCIGGAGK